MLNIQLICIGKIKEDYLKNAIEEYRKRLSKYCKLEILELPDEKIPDKLNSTLSDEIKQAVDYIVEARQEEKTEAKPSGIIKVGKGGLIKVIRE